VVYHYVADYDCRIGNSIRDIRNIHHMNGDILHGDC
jgi:hypothetical protein